MRAWYRFGAPLLGLAAAQSRDFDRLLQSVGMDTSLCCKVASSSARSTKCPEKLGKSALNAYISGNLRRAIRGDFRALPAALRTESFS